MNSVPLTRSEVMGRVKGKDTRPEWLVRRALRRAGVGYRLHRRDLPGKPDIVLATRRMVVFVHGCFWHRHADCPRATTPKSRIDFWEAKFADNVARDARDRAALEALGWRVMVIWECECRDAWVLDTIVSGIAAAPVGRPLPNGKAPK